MFCSLTLKVYIVLFRVVWKGESYIFFPYDMFNKEAKTGNTSFENEYMVMSFVFIGVVRKIEQNEQNHNEQEWIIQILNDMYSDENVKSKK